MQDHTFTLVLLFVLIPWSLAVVLKSSNRLRARQPYVFGVWDGGLLMQGTALKRRGTIGMLAFAVISSCVGLYILGGTLG